MSILTCEEMQHRICSAVNIALLLTYANEVDELSQARPKVLPPTSGLTLETGSVCGEDRRVDCETYGHSPSQRNRESTQHERQLSRNYNRRASHNFVALDELEETIEQRETNAFEVQDPPIRTTSDERGTERISTIKNSTVASSCFTDFELHESAAAFLPPKELLARFHIFSSYSLRNGPSHPGRVRGAFLINNEKQIVSCGGESFSKLSSLSTLQLQGMFLGHEKPLVHVAVSNDARLLGTSGSDGLLCIFDLHTSKKLVALSHPDMVSCASFLAERQVRCIWLHRRHLPVVANETHPRQRHRVVL